MLLLEVQRGATATVPQSRRAVSNFPFRFPSASIRPRQNGVPNSAPLAGSGLCLEHLGYKHAGQKGSHIKLEKPGVAPPLIVPAYDEVGRDIIMNLIRTAGITREAFLALLENC